MSPNIFLAYFVTYSPFLRIFLKYIHLCRSQRFIFVSQKIEKGPFRISCTCAMIQNKLSFLLQITVDHIIYDCLIDLSIPFHSVNRLYNEYRWSQLIIPSIKIYCSFSHSLSAIFRIHFRLLSGISSIFDVKWLHFSFNLLLRTTSL